MTKNTVTITITNGSNTLTIGPGQDCDFTKPVTGLEASEITNHTTDLALADGESYDGTKLKARPIHIEAQFKSTSHNAEYRHRLIRLFNPKNITTLTVTAFETTRTIDCIIEGWALAKVTNNDNKIGFVVDFEAPDPYMQSTDDFGRDMATIVPLMAFPWRMLATKAPDVTIYPEEARGMLLGGMPTGYKLVSLGVPLNNDGDVSCGLRVRIVASGAVTWPKITNGSGEFIRIRTTLSAGDELIIDTKQRKQRITLNGSNAWNLIDKASTMFQLEPGNNYIGYDAESGQANMSVYLYYTPRYLGV